MKLKSFTVQKYRSIIAAKRIPTGRTTILVGPNNEGKSNILRALVTAMNILTRERYVRGQTGRIRGGLRNRRTYDWETDFPIALQEKQPKGETVVILEFELTPEDLDAFRAKIGSRLTGTLPLQIAVGQNGYRVTVHKRGPGSVTLSQKSDQIAKFVTDRIDFQHIEAIRTASAAEEVVSDMVAKELQQLEDVTEYQDALRKVDELQKPILSNLSASIHRTLQQFLPDIKAVSVQIPPVARYRALRMGCEIEVDDGTATLLQYKGDGAQSLAALGIIRHASESGARGKYLVIAIEEPESHLHPAAIHKLKQVLDELSDKHQVLITTHNPLFVDRRTIHNNVIVKGSRAKPAQSVGQVRDILGVRAADNLRHAELVLVVEGEDDRVALRALLSHHSPTLEEALRQGTLGIDTLAGGSNLTYKLTLLRQSLCETHACLDNDKAGREAFEKARTQGLITDADLNMCVCQGLTESELEDLYDASVYRDLLQNRWRVSIDSPRFKSKKKWTDRIADCFGHCGKHWTDRLAVDVKTAVAEAVAAAPAAALNAHHKACFDSLVKALEDRLKARAEAQQAD